MAPQARTLPELSSTSANNTRKHVIRGASSRTVLLALGDTLSLHSMPSFLSHTSPRLVLLIFQQGLHSLWLIYKYYNADFDTSFLGNLFFLPTFTPY